MTGADPFGFPTMNRPWDDGSNSMENAKRRLRAAFEFYQKLGVCHTLHANGHAGMDGYAILLTVHKVYVAYKWKS